MKINFINILVGSPNMQRIFSASLIASICVANDEMGPSVVAEKVTLNFDRDNKASY